MRTTDLGVVRGRGTGHGSNRSLTPTGQTTQSPVADRGRTRVCTTTPETLSSLRTLYDVTSEALLGPDSRLPRQTPVVSLVSSLGLVVYTRSLLSSLQRTHPDVPYLGRLPHICQNSLPSRHLTLRQVDPLVRPCSRHFGQSPCPLSGLSSVDSSESTRRDEPSTLPRETGGGVRLDETI